MQCSESGSPVTTTYQFGWFDRFCLAYPPGWLILFNRHWQHYKPDPQGWRWSEYLLFLLPGGFYLAVVIRWLRLAWLRSRSVSCPAPTGVDADYQQAFRDEILTPIVQRYFRAELQHLEALPLEEPLIITLNHAGMCFPWDFLGLAWLLREQRDWWVQPLAHPLFFDHPWLQWWLPAGWADCLGAVRAEPTSFEAAIAQQRVMIYAPEGWRGLAKGWQQRYQLAKFDSSFVQLSCRYRVPILPVICMGSEWLHPFASNLRWVARWVQMPMFPISPLIPVFALFPSMGIWANRSRLRYYVQPVWRPWEEAAIAPPVSPRSYRHQLAQKLRSRLQTTINTLRHPSSAEKLP